MKRAVSSIALFLGSVSAVCANQLSLAKSANEFKLSPITSNSSVSVRNPGAPVSSILFVSHGANQTNLYNSKYQNVGVISGPSGKMATDRFGDLYVEPTGMFNGVVHVYRPPYSGHPMVVKVPYEAFGLAVDPITGMLAVLTVSGFGGAQSHVFFFRRGDSRPCNIVHPQLPGGNATFGAFDKEGTLFLPAGYNSNYMYAIAGGCKASNALQLSFPIQMQIYGYFGIDPNDNFIIQSSNGYHAPIYTFTHPVNNAFGMPIATTNLARDFDPGHGSIPVHMVAMSSDGRQIFAENDFSPVLFGVYDYPRGGKPVTRLDNVRGAAAVTPPMIP